MSFIVSGNDAQVKEVVLGVPSEDGVVAQVEDITVEQPEESVEDNNVPEVAPAPAAVTPSTSVKQVEKPAASKPAAATSAKLKGKYNIIVGSFKESQNADKEVQRFRQLGYSNARSVLNDGFYYVSLNSFATRDEALNYKLKLAEKNVQGWIKELN
jgi:cell division septation protein DedD